MTVPTGTVQNRPAPPPAASRPAAPARRPGARARFAAVPLVGPGALYITLLVLVPVALITVYSFFERGRFGGVVWTFTLDNFARLFDPLYLSVVGNSLVIAAIVTLLALLIGYPTALMITRLSPKWRTVALIAVLLPFWTNFLIRTYAWILLLNNAGWVNQALQALGITDEPISMLYTPQAVVVGLLYMYLPLMILPLYSALAHQDRQLGEAATDLGASPFRVFRTVTVPLSIPGILTGCVFVFVPAMSNFVIPELIGGGKTVLVGNLIRDQFLKARDWPFGAALALVLTVSLLLLLVLQSRLSKRLTEGKRQAEGKKVRRDA
ncbi:ABC transporter permease [Herbiconiux sp. VKM Ac-2851]|uniref:ABC transporter permease n=1 Tax=Herbiconiux sp. VKM Ac-2851 TaxID=2739025 RepID=UPI001564EAD3|nr:ABC transporter permease [Herbiconiux sp. VKM Ac-2851]NQX36350.1 ABC transporter permease [Herbiconiux sp. VKM Ac-2851]